MPRTPMNYGPAKSITIIGLLVPAAVLATSLAIFRTSGQAAVDTRATPLVVPASPTAHTELPNATAPALATSTQPAQLCAYMTYEETCGWNNSGRKAFVQNRETGTRVRATVETTWQRGNDGDSEQQEVLVSAGGKRYVVCSRSDDYPPIERTFEVVGCAIVPE